MKRVNIITNILSIFSFIFTTIIFIIFPIQAKASDEKLIPGIDYNRITQKVTAGSKSYPVELTLGELTFNGELVGSHGLDADELNTIINAVLKEKGLTADRVALVSQIAARIEKDAALYWGDQIIEGLLSYIPTFNIPVGINDYYVYMVHGKEKTIADTAKDFALDRAVSAAEKAIEKPRGMMGKLNKLSGSTRRIPMLGEMINTVKVASGWLSGSERFDNYLKLLEENLAEINDFYTTCSRRANDLAEQKGEVNSWQIKFDGEKNTRTYEATFWGIPGVKMNATLSGVLEKVSGENTAGSGDNVVGNVDNNNESTPVNNIFILPKDEDDILNYPIGVSSGVGYGMSGLIPEFTSGSDTDVTGTYSGTLWLDLEAVNPANDINKKFVSHHSTGQWWASEAVKAGNSFTDGDFTTTILKRFVQGEVSVIVTEGSGKQSSTLSGSLTSGNDELNFSFKHHCIVTNPGAGGVLNFSSNNIESLHLEYTAQSYFANISIPIVRDYKQDPGNIWEPLESKPTLLINFD